MAGIARFSTKNFPHGTRARYTRKCRCAPCRKANADYYRQRKAAARAGAADLKPNRPKFEHSLTAFGRSTPDGRRQVVVNVAMCPGVNRRKCVQGGAWLKNGGPVCVACIERATVWNGLVGTTKVRRHLRKLSAKGIGRRAVAAACDVSATIIFEVESGRKKKIRAKTAQRLLAVDEGARADGSLVPGAKTYALLQGLFDRGFTLRWVTAALGASGTSAPVTQSMKRGREFITARSAADVERLHRRVVEQDIKAPPPKGRVDAAEMHEQIDELLDQGFTLTELSDRTGVRLMPPGQRRAVCRATTAEKVAQLHHQKLVARPIYGDRLSIDDFATARNA